MTRHFGLLMPAIVAATLAFASSAFAQDVPSMDSLYERAKAEGEVIFGGAIKEEAGQALLDAFAAKYPGIKVSYTRRATEPMVQLIEAGRTAKKVSFDVINLTEPADLVRWRDQGYLAAVPIENLDKMRPNTFDPGFHYYSLGITPMYGIYNTKSLTPAQAPKSLKELLNDEKWRGKIAISRPTRGGTNAIALLNIVKLFGEDIFAKAKKLDVLLTRGNEAAVTSVISGERPVSWGVSGYRALEARADGAPIELIFWEEGLPMALFMGAVPAQAPHPNAARLLLRWLLSEQGQTLFVKAANFYSPRTDITATPGSEKPLSELPVKIFAAEEVINEGHRLAVKYDEAVGLR